ncbi:hypothetical protein EV356DRAFT_534662 [Viridothelium virens]|uniref:Uncharacterized protein n=1 Tax=Viridothelium virens TaxID=1048519 RepID=A0A6A6H397_VIRVR|nr:hypothetical protein EV356DRAFT_534662 [Viridothelium virens]
MAIHRTLLHRGFLLKRNGLSTNSQIGFFIGGTATAWFITSWIASVPPRDDSDRMMHFLFRLTDAPVLVETIFLCWFLGWADANLAMRTDEKHFHFWSLRLLSDPFDWQSGVTKPFLWTIYLFVTISVSIQGIAAMFIGNYTSAVLNIIGLGVFLTSGAGNNPYVGAPHWYTGDMVRVILPTSHHQGTVYVLPSQGHGFDAVWSPKVAAEHREADSQAMELFHTMRTGTWGHHLPLASLRKTLANFYGRLRMTPQQCWSLAAWLYEDTPGAFDTASAAGVKRTIECIRAPGTHLIGRDLMYALCHAEYIVFMSQGSLPARLRARIGRIRLMKRSGMMPTEISDGHTIGYLPGLEGYRDAVRYIYRLFALPVDASALDFAQISPPRQSIALGGRSCTSAEQYAADLWDLSCEHSESTFSALYFFTAVWFMEIGNIGGFNILPFRARSFDGDLTSQQIVWRQVWYTAVIAQLIAASPILYAAFVTGLLR